MDKNWCGIIVDDDKSLCSVIKASLDTLNFFRQIVLSHDGMDAKRKITNQKFDLIILDIIMPKLDGISLLKTLVEDRKMDPNKILLVSGAIDAENILKAKKWNVKNVITKPFTQDVLIQKIKAE